MNGGDRVAEALAAQGVRFLFTLCGGHISPILVGAKARGIRVVDVRDEASAVFAADAVSRLTGLPGAAAVTAGPGLTNAITAVKNAQLAQSPVVVLGGATATALKGRGALQDIDQEVLLRPHVKFLAAVRRVRDLGSAVAAAFHAAQTGTPGPVLVECPVDLLYPEPTVREWYGIASEPTAGGVGARLSRWYLRRHVQRLFAGGEGRMPEVHPVNRQPPGAGAVRRAAHLVKQAERPVLLLGSQVTRAPADLAAVREAIETLALPVFLSGMARGLLGRSHPLLLRHRRGAALRDADLVVLLGVPCDFRLDYGRAINPRARVIAANTSAREATRNRRPTLTALGDPARFLIGLAGSAGGGAGRLVSWTQTLRQRDEDRTREIERLAQQPSEYVNPLALCRAIEAALPDDSVIVADGGDFVGTASYIVSPRGPLSWLDPGPFGTLGVGAGFALGAKLCRPEAEVWILYGDGSAAFSLAEFDSFVRHGLGVIAVVGNDAGWTQIARGQVETLRDDVGTVLRHTDYEQVAKGYGGRGLRVTRADQLPQALREAQTIARDGMPVLVNVLIGKSDFRAGSLAI